MSKVLFIAPHPDDETLGCGGNILKHKNKGDDIYWLIMTNISTEYGYEADRVKSRKNEIEKVTKAYEFNKVVNIDFPAARLDNIPRVEIIERISQVLNDLKPDIIYLPNRSDVHSDHFITFDCVMSAAKSFRCTFIKKVLSYEVISETEFSAPFQSSVFVPNCFSDITDYLEKKIDIMGIYTGEIGEHPFPRSGDNIKALATFRGASANIKYAEAFMTIKEIW